MSRRCSLPVLLPSFHQPVSMPDFFDRIRDQKVLLENAFSTIEDVSSSNVTPTPTLSVKGTVRVKNMDFHKSVYVRYSYDEWQTFNEFQVHLIKSFHFICLIMQSKKK
jgi:protein phosphatase 1 regulatory subunit 3A/B/C/D/E